MKISLTEPDFARASALSGDSLAMLAARYPGDSGGRQPVHTVYGGAQLFKSDTPKRLGALALRALEEFAPDAETFDRAIVSGCPRRDRLRARGRKAAARAGGRLPHRLRGRLREPAG